MTDKTRLELDIESHERIRTRAGIKILIIFLLIGLVVAGWCVLWRH